MRRPNGIECREQRAQVCICLLHAHLELGDLGGLDIGRLLVQHADQSRSSKGHTNTSSGGIDLVVGLTGINPCHLHAATAEIQKQSATFNTDKTTAGTHDSAKQGLDSRFKDAYFETISH
ncbi:hypothetical protein HG530_004996 [Fusarium avenaceum]|nr:hypothetical protein HG530_004996 [Fusarium avenaceum]